MWFLHELAKSQPARFNGSRHFRLSGPVERTALKRAVTALADRHEVLRTTFSAAQGQLVPVVHPRAADCFEFEVASPEVGGPRLATTLAAQRRRPFDLSIPLMFRVTLQQLSSDDHLLHIVYHQIAVDELSIEVLLDELGHLYRGFCGEAVSDLLPPVQLTEPHRSDVEDALDREYWVSELSDVPPRVDLPAYRPPTEHQHDGHVISFDLGSEVTDDLWRLANATRTDPTGVLLVTLALLLARWGVSDDVVIGTPFSRRDTSTRRVVGPLANPLPVRVGITPRQTFRELLKETTGRRRLVEEHALLPFAELVRELDRTGSADGNPLFGAHIRSRRADRQQLDFGSVGAKLVEPRSVFARYELDLVVSESADSVTCSFTFSKDRFDAGTMAEFARQFEHLLCAALRSPDDVALLLELEPPTAAIARAREMNETAVIYPRDRTLGELFEAAVETHGDRVAIVHGQESLTFNDLARRATGAAQDLLRSGVEPGDFVGILARRDVATITAMIATTLTGAAYVPLDPDLPSARLHEILDDAQPRVVVGDTLLGASLGLGAIIELDKVCPTAFDGLPRRIITAGEPAYMIYTSGSTGRPKGVVVPHRSVVRLIVNSDFLPLSAGDAFGLISNLGFDVSVIEVWGPLLNGARIEIIPDECRLDPPRLVDFIRERGLTTLFLSSLHFAAVIREVPDALRTLDTFMVGADVVEAAPVRRAMMHGAPGRFVIAYGPTEATVWCCFAEIHDPPGHRKEVPIGRPAANNTVYVRNTAGALAAPWEPGELFVGGDGVATGYWRRPSLTAEVFLADPFSDAPGARLYRTGDRVVQSLDGALHFLGRADRQVKVRGHRVEPAEIESRIVTLHGASGAVVSVEGDGITRRLVAHVARSAGAALTSEDVVAELERLLPSHMVPQNIVVVDDLPINRRGKIDMERLTALDTQESSETNPPRDRIETLVAQCYAEVLDTEMISPDQDFFALGGHSLLALELLARIEEQLGLNVSLVSFMRHSSVRALVRHLESVRSNEDRALVGQEQQNPGQLEPLARMVSAWTGTRANSNSLLVQRNVDGGGRPLYWCFQGEGELDGLARHLGPANPIVGMRSAHAICEPMSDMIPALARRYAQEIVELDERGPYVIGGNCAGAEVAFAVAWELERRGLEVELLIIMERVIDAPYPGDVVMLYGRDSIDDNPYLSGAPSDEVFADRYGSYRVDIIAGQHGAFFRNPNIEVLAERLRRYLEDPFADPIAPPDHQALEPLVAHQSERGSLVQAPTTAASSSELPPGDRARIDHEEHRDRHFLLERSKELGPIFKATTTGGRLAVCVVGFETCKRLLREHAADLGPNSLSLSELFPKGIIREMHGADHAAYRAPLIRSLARIGTPSVDEVVQRMAAQVLQHLADKNTDSDSTDIWTALDTIATGSLIEVFFGAEPDTDDHRALMTGFKKLGPDGMVWVPGAPQRAAFDQLRLQLLDLVDHAGTGRAGSGVLQHMAAHGDLDETSLGNLIYMVEIGRFDMASLMRWLMKLAADHPTTLDEIRVCQDPSDAEALTNAFVLETLRLHQSERLMRIALEDISFDGYLIPKDAVVRLCLWESHKDPTTFVDPFRFDPRRFLANTYTSDHFAPFGLGGRRCPASDIAIALASGLVTTMASSVRPVMVEDGPPIHGAWHWEPNPCMKVRWERVVPEGQVAETPDGPAPSTGEKRQRPSTTVADGTSTPAFTG